MKERIMLKARRDVRTPIGNCNDVPVMSAIGVYVQTSGSVSPSFFSANEPFTDDNYLV